MSEIVIARDDLRTVDETTVREAVQDIHGEDVEFLDEPSDLVADDGPETTLAEWSA